MCLEAAKLPASGMFCATIANARQILRQQLGYEPAVDVVAAVGPSADQRSHRHITVEIRHRVGPRRAHLCRAHHGDDDEDNEKNAAGDPRPTAVTYATRRAAVVCTQSAERRLARPIEARSVVETSRRLLCGD